MKSAIHPTCACGCQRPLPPEAAGRRRYASDACRQRGHRGRTAQRRRAADQSLTAALSGRDLVSLLEAAHQAALQRPGSVLLRVSGRLTTLSAAELGELLGLLRARDDSAA